MNLTTTSTARPPDGVAQDCSTNAQTNDLDFLRSLGLCVRSIRQRLHLTRKTLSEQSGVSPRFIAQLECGEGNISIMRLKRIADVLAMPLEALVALRDDAAAAESFEQLRVLPSKTIAHVVGRVSTPFAHNRVALIGLRGAGKTTLGAKAADKIDVAFVELNAEIEQRNGLGISEIFALYGEERYRKLEQEALEQIVAEDRPIVMAVAGGIVEHPDTYRTLLENFATIWLQASPDEHMARVLAQGDRRPVAGHPSAMENLREILRDREQAYAQAHFQLCTSGKPVAQSVDDLVDLVEPLCRKSMPKPVGDREEHGR
ncbi:MAG: helix-turn-helix transcriptional regulator [Hyphomicrobiaceae bacterium]